VKARIQKWGNSLALRIPKAFAADAEKRQAARELPHHIVDGELIRALQHRIMCDLNISISCILSRRSIVVRYEDLRCDPLPSLRRVTDCIAPVSDECLRRAINDCEIGGYQVPAGTQVFMFQWATQRDSRFYDEPAAFRPERWTEDFIEQLPKYAYFPFGGGPRVCIGASFAMMEIILCLAAIGQEFRLELDRDIPVSIYPAMSLRPKDGIKVVVKRRRA